MSAPSPASSATSGWCSRRAARGVHVRLDAPLEFTEPKHLRQVLGAPDALRDLNDVPDHPPTDADGWVQVVRRSQWLADDELRSFIGQGPEITDDRPRSEYFLWRRAFMDDPAYISDSCSASRPTTLTRAQRLRDRLN